MSQKSNDRALKTKELLKESYIKLLGQNDAEKITVTEICNAAGITRSTFYSYYPSACALLNSITSDFLNEVFNLLAVDPAKNFSREKKLCEMFDLFRKNHALISYLLNTDQQKKFTTIIYSGFYSLFESDFNSIEKEKHDSLTAFIIEGVFGMIQVWIDSGMKTSSKKMSEFSVLLINECFSVIR